MQKSKNKHKRLNNDIETKTTEDTAKEKARKRKQAHVKDRKHGIELDREGESPSPNISDHSPYDMVAANSGSMYPGVPATCTTHPVGICPSTLVHGTDWS